MIVVSDTSPLIYLNLVGAIDVLPQLFGRVYVPGAVLQEIKDSRNPQLGPVRRWAGSPPAWLEVREPTPGFQASRVMRKWSVVIGDTPRTEGA